ncbi:type I restriction endonuclease subunit M [Rhodoferax sp. PAMC 29310]|uniref:type I restriction endonuclease subunit M n=1 Tax=Rhodoferax sp. PAMC 29310 TaxID=2822760 RepID=UPI001B33BA6C|nr:type I restriction endonuclease subunit M [Rhodoferax sp. PAMC 29310]
MSNETTTNADDSRSQTPVTIITNSAKFSLGQVVATPGALALLQTTGRSAACLLARHLHGDWGDICRDDAAMNEQAITDGSRIMSVYRLVDVERHKATPKQRRSDLPTVWIITDGTNGAGQREATTFLLPEDY